MSVALWILAALMMLVGAIGTVVPALPGVALVFGGALLGAWIDSFALVGGWTVASIGVLSLLAWGVDYAAAALGARRAGASRQAVLGAFAGTLLGIFSGLWGLLFMPLVGAAAGEYLARRDAQRAGAVGVATWIGMLIGTVAKLALTFVMIGIFVAALLI